MLSKSLKLLKVLTLTALLSACSTKTYNNSIELPEIPLAGEKAARELKAVCDDQKCFYLNEWLNQLYLFKIEYEIIRNNSKNATKNI